MSLVINDIEIRSRLGFDTPLNKIYNTNVHNQTKENKKRNHNFDVHVYDKVSFSNNLKMCNKTAIL